MSLILSGDFKRLKILSSWNFGKVKYNTGIVWEPFYIFCFYINFPLEHATDGALISEQWAVTLCTNNVQHILLVMKGALSSITKPAGPAAAIFQNVTLAHLSYYLLRFCMQRREPWEEGNFLKAQYYCRRAIALSEITCGWFKAWRKKASHRITILYGGVWKLLALLLI